MKMFTILLHSHQLDCVKACLLIGESSKENLGGIPSDFGGEASAKEMEDIIRNMGVVNIEKGEINAKEVKEKETGVKKCP